MNKAELDQAGAMMNQNRRLQKRIDELESGDTIEDVKCYECGDSVARGGRKWVGEKCFHETCYQGLLSGL